MARLEGVRVTNLPIMQINTPWHGSPDPEAVVDFTELFKQTREAGKLWPESMPKIIVTDELMLVDGNHRMAPSSHRP